MDVAKADNEGTGRTRVLIVEDDHRTRAALERIIASQADLAVAGTAGNVADGRALLDTDFDVALIDLGLPDGSGIALVADIARKEGRLAVVLTVFGDEASVLAAIEAGASGYILKDAADIPAAIREVRAGGAPLSAGIAQHILRRLRTGGHRTTAHELTGRELQVLELLARGIGYRESAEQLGISYNTVCDHIKNVYRKLAVGSRSEAVYEALKRGIIHIEC